MNGYGQLLNWQFENVTSDRQQPGVYPDMVIGSNGDIHFSFWDKSRDQLIYGKREAASGNYTYEDVDPTTFSGYRSAIALDPSGKVHIAYYLNNQGSALLRYATNASGNWAVEIPAPDSLPLGKYGVDQGLDSYLELSLDIVFDPTGQPVISYFDGLIDDFIFCNAVQGLLTALPKTFELDMHVTHRDPNGTWTAADLDIKSRKTPGTCNKNGDDRFGEFSKLVPLGTDKMLAITNSFYNHEMILGEAQMSDLENWNFTVIDSIERFVTSNIRFEDAFGFCDAHLVGDSILHLVYNSSSAYGFELFSGGSRNPLRNFFYTQIRLDSLADSLYVPYHHQFANFPYDFHYRTFQTITARGKDSIYIAHYNASKNVMVLSESIDAGLTWVDDTVKVDANSSSSLVLESHGDSLFLMGGSSSNENISLFSRHINQGVWQEQNATVNEKRATYLGADIERLPSGVDNIHVAFDEKFNDQLYYGLRSGGSWMFEAVDIPEMNVRHIDVKADGGSNPAIAYVFEEVDQLKFAYLSGGSWMIDVVDDSSMAQEVKLVISGDTAHVIYYSRTDKVPRHARSKLGSGSWTSEIIDHSSLNTGRTPDVVLDNQGGLHVVFRDESLSEVMYGYRNNGVWTVEVVTDTLLYEPSQMSISMAPVKGLPVIAFRDNSENRIMLAEKKADGTWNISEIIKSTTNFLGTPLKLIVGPKDNPAVLYNYVTTSEEVRLLRRSNNTWNPIAVNNSREIAGTFDFLSVDFDFFIIGRKNKTGDQGVGMLFAPGGVKVDIVNDTGVLSGATISPNPAKDKFNASISLEKPAAVSIQVIDLSGKVLRTIGNGRQLSAGEHSLDISTDGLGNGIYFVRIIQDKQTVTRKLVILR
ncbi:T9SS type A sorting domain-containing protein [bacterium]|nr:T9SS type A sorting domain-containing protein [bacterium]